MSEPQQIINVGQVANDGTGESLRDAFNAVNNNFANVWAAGPVNSQVVISNNRVSTNETNLDLILSGNGIGNVTVASTTLPSLDAVYDLGRANRRFDEVHAVYYYGNGAYLTGINANGTGGGNVYFSQGAPNNPAIGDIWIESDTGVQYLYFNDNTSNQWAEMEAYQSFSYSAGSNVETGNWAFTGNSIYNINGGSVNNSDLSHGQTAFLNLPANGNTAPISLLNYYGNVAITAATSPGNTQTWTFNSSGNIVLPSNTSSINYANGQPYGSGGGAANTGNVTFDNINIIGTGNLHLQPDPANSGSYLDIFLTSGPDLHLVASAAANLILGKDDGANVMTSWNGNAYVQSWNLNTGNVGGVWTFGGDGNLTAPGAINVGDMSIGQLPGYITANANTGIILNVSGTDGGFVVDYLEEDGNANTSGGELALSAELGNTTYRISLSDDFGNGFATKIWRFDGTGNLTLPSNTFAVNYANGTPVSLGGNYGDSNVATFLAAYGSNTVSTTGNITSSNLSVTGNITGNTAGFAVGYRDIPQVSFSANATAALTDAGKHYYSTTAGNLALTLPDNSNVALPTGATLTVVVNAAGNVLVNQGTGVSLYMAGSSTTGNRVVGAYGLASVMKVAANVWVISGTGVY